MRSSYEPLRTRLLEDGLFKSGLMQTIQEDWNQQKFHPNQTSLHYLEQPFPAQTTSTLYPHVFSPHASGIVRIERVFSDQRTKVLLTQPYSGRILLRFECSTLL